MLGCKFLVTEKKFRKKCFQQSKAGNQFQAAFTCSKLMLETLEQGVKYVPVVWESSQMLQV